MLPRGAHPGVLLAVALLAGCSGGDTSGEGGSGAGASATSSATTTTGSGASCALGFLGDPALAPELRLRARGLSGISAVIDEGGTIPIITPPQGGRVLFIGVEVTNMVPCSVELEASIRDPGTESVRVDSRTVNLAPRGDGWGTSLDESIGTFAHLPVCPNQWSSKDIYDQPHEVEVTVTDKEGRVAHRIVSASPACVEEGPLYDGCLCICKQGYVVGEACP